MARIDTPRLSSLETTFFDDMDFNTPELNQFISRTPTLGPYDEAHLVFYVEGAQVTLRQSHPEPKWLKIEITDLELSTVARICTMLLRLLSTTENLYIDEGPFSPHRWNYDNNSEWLDLLHSFKAVKNLYVSKIYSSRIAFVLQELTGERATEVLPALQNIRLRGFRPSKPIEEGISQFISARQLTNHPVAISAWHRRVRRAVAREGVGD